MSWCRFSTICENNKKSSLYIYEDVGGGVTILVAARKRKNEEFAPKLPDILEVGTEEWLEAVGKRGAWIEKNAPLLEINLPYAGETFNLNDKEELISFLYKLKEIGYNFPEYVFDIAKEWKMEE